MLIRRVDVRRQRRRRVAGETMGFEGRLAQALQEQQLAQSPEERPNGGAHSSF